MKKEALIQKLSDALVLEETRVMTELNEVKAFVGLAGFSGQQKDQIINKIDFLMQDSAKHAKMVADLIKKVNSSDRKDY